MTHDALPGAPFLQRDAQGDLRLDGVALEPLARRFGTPLYVYSEAALLAAARGYQQALSGRRHLLCYAVKANGNLALLQTLARAGWGFDIVSGGELARALAAGGDPAKIVFSGVGKTADEIAQALQAGVRCFNAESEAELHRLSEVACRVGRTARISLRVNPDVDAGTHPYISTGLRDNKFGIAHDRARAAYRLAASLPGLKVEGIDCHIGSQITQVAPYLDALDRLLALVEEVEADGIALPHLDLGGGLGIRYTDERPPATEDLVRQMLARIDQRGHGHREVLMEPGRSVVGNAGVMLTEVILTKPGEGKQFCIVDAGMNDLVRPAMYQATMGIVACRSRTDLEARRWDVVGPVCESSDWLGRDRELAVESGDVLAVLSAGAYGMTMASNYNTRARAAEVLVRGGQPLLVRRRETVAELMAHDLLPPG